MNAANVNTMSPPPSDGSSKMKSVKSTRPSGSTPLSFSARTASLFSIIFSNSFLEIVESPLSSMAPITCAILPFTKFTVSASFSVAATALTTSQRIPIRVFKTVSAANKMNTKKNTAKNKLPPFVGPPRSSRTTFRSSKKVPCTSKVYMAEKIVEKYMAPASVPDINCTKAMAKMYIRIMSSMRTKNTERTDAIIPRTRIMSSGIARNIRTILDRRKRRNNRKIDAFPKPTLLPLPVARITPVIAHVSKTIIPTNSESNTNQASLNPFSLFWNDWNLTNHSKAKKKQKACSAIWKMG
mmetsp:Transcript_29015/g.76535  ORF Transcript_29015/g.76535 Transcript_29015/m.76535 type:complete len:297 (-) Transcript_29015:414-1304(-)